MKLYEVFGDAKWVCAGEYAGYANTTDANGTPAVTEAWGGQVENGQLKPTSPTPYQKRTAAKKRSSPFHV